MLKARWIKRLRTLWICGVDTEFYEYMCSECKYLTEDKEDECPVCGAHMERSGSGE